MERYEFSEGKSSKFWEAKVTGDTLTVRFGRLGTDGQTKEKRFPSADAAEKEKTKLVKEKLGKGYIKVADGSAAEPVAATPKAAMSKAATEPADEPTVADKPANTQEKSGPPTRPIAAPATQGRLFEAVPLPTRLRPQPIRAPGVAWAKVRAIVGGADLEPESDGFEARQWLQRRIGAPPATLSLGEAATWYQMFGQSRWTPILPMVAAFSEWLTATRGALFAIQVADLVRPPMNERRSYTHSAWSHAPSIGLRKAITQASETDYEEALAWALRTHSDDQDHWHRAAYLTFILADDRPTPHALQAMAVLKNAEAQAINITDERCLFPLLVDAPPFAAAHWRVYREHVFYFYYSQITAAEAAATLMAVAQANAEPATPGLAWLLRNATEENRTTIAEAILETREADSVEELLPFLHEKWIRKALDNAAEAYPSFLFRECLSVSASSRIEPAVRARVTDMIQQHDVATVREWVNDLAPKVVNHLESLIGAAATEMASPEALPAVLRSPPWRQKAAKTMEDIVLAIDPIATPFACALTGKRWIPRYGYRANRELALSDMTELPKFITMAETTKKYSWAPPLPTPHSPPRADMTPEEVLTWLKQRLTDINRDHARGIGLSNYEKLYDGLERLPDPLALMLWELTGPLVNYGLRYETQDVAPTMLSRFGEQACPGLLKLIESDPVFTFPFADYVDAPGIAPLAARALLKLKKARPLAIQWLKKYPRTAITRLIPDAVGARGSARDAAEHALRWYNTQSSEDAELVGAIVEDYAKAAPRVREAMAQVLNRDPLAQFPAKIAKLPPWLSLGALARPELRSGGALPNDAMQALAEMLAFSTPDTIYAGVAVVREACKPKSLGQFAWDLFSAWLAAGAPSKDGFAMRTLGWIGDDECARQLTRLVRKWPGESAHARAVTGLDVLADIGTDVALMNLNGIAEKLKFKGLRDKAREKIAAIAEAREMTPQELADRLAPELDLDERGGIDLDFGPRRFRAGFDEFLKPWVKDQNNVRLKDLPKPNKSDDAELSAAAVARWSALKKDARAVATQQLTRLETMLATSRRVRPDVFWTFFAAHPLIRHLAQRLVWGIYDDAAPAAMPRLAFRVTEDLSFTDAHDNPVEIDVSADAKGLIGLVHPLQVEDGELALWGTLFGDYEIAQPFPQLARETFQLSEAEKASAKVTRFDGVQVEAARLRGMGARDWQLGAPQDGGGISWIEREVVLADGQPAVATLQFGDGLIAGGAEYEEKLQTLQDVALNRTAVFGEGVRFGELDPITASEILRGPALLVRTAKT